MLAEIVFFYIFRHFSDFIVAHIHRDLARKFRIGIHSIRANNFTV